MRETPGKKNNPWIFDILDHWSVFGSMYYKRKAIYKKGGFKIDSDRTPTTTGDDESELFKGKCLI